MAKPFDLQDLLNEASKLEKAYDWPAASTFYEKALLMVTNDASKTGQILEDRGYSLYRAAMQAAGVEDFEARVRGASLFYARARDHYNTLAEPQKTPLLFRCDAFIAYLAYWIATDGFERKKLIDNCWALAKESLNGFETAGDAAQFVSIYNRLHVSAVLSFELDWNFETRKQTMKEAADYGEKATRLTASSGDAYEFARTHANTATSLRTLASLLAPGEREYFRQKALSHFQKAFEFSPEAATLELWDSNLWGSGTDEALKNFQMRLDFGRKTKDKMIILSALEQVAYHTTWRARLAEDPDQRRQLQLRALRFAEEAREKYYSAPGKGPHNPTYGGPPIADHFWALALDETDLEGRLNLLKKAVEASPESLRQAEIARFPRALSEAHHEFGKVLTALAAVETDLHKKKRLLEEALPHEKEAIRIVSQILPFRYYSLGAVQNYAADLEFQLASLAEESIDKARMLREAIQLKEDALKLCAHEQELEETVRGYSTKEALGRWQYQCGDMLLRLFELSGEKSLLKAATRYFGKAAESYQKIDHVSRMADCYWKIAQAYDLLEEHLTAAENFDRAANAYKASGDKIPPFKAVYQDHVLYMEAWGKIEKALDSHLREDYVTAQEYYEKAASLHEATNRWNFLASDYSAWAQVENAENLSRLERCEEASRAFQRAYGLFHDAQKRLEKEISGIEIPEERKMAARLLQAVSVRQQYCRARIMLEQARILDKEGDHRSSSEKFGLAAQGFQDIAKDVTSETDREQILLISTLSSAWERMALAEGKASAELYLEASRLFEDAGGRAKNQRSGMLALGHSRFCKALAAGASFTDTREPAQYVASMEHLESAANYYLRSGFENAAENADATKLLLEAYSLMDKANLETNHEKRAKLFAVVEKLLHSSSEIFTKINQPIKTRQVKRFLARVRRERELAFSVAEIMTAPSILSTTSAFTTPIPTHERPVGLERFENADVRASLVVGQRDVQIGERLSIEIELVNAGRGLAQLVKIDSLVPTGFDIVEKPEKYGLANGALDLRGKRLGPLKTEEIRLQAKANARGLMPLSANVHYLDESGSYKLCRADPVEIVVREPHFPEWLDNQEKIPFPMFRFETERARQVFLLLARAFREDYVSKGLFIDRAGWRTLTRLTHESQLPRSAFYGPKRRRGPVLAELERLGVVELRLFPEERGRGGAVTKARLAYEKIILKRVA